MDEKMRDFLLAASDVIVLMLVATNMVSGARNKQRHTGCSGVFC